MIRQINIDNLFPFKETLFSIDDNWEMGLLIDSIKKIGIIEPLIIRKAGRGYEVISGSRRLYAAILAELEAVPAIVMDLTDEEASIIMVDSNFHRERIKPSEKAFAFKLREEAMAERYSVDK